jgi:hypothetical protein
MSSDCTAPLNDNYKFPTPSVRIVYGCTTHALEKGLDETGGRCVTFTPSRDGIIEEIHLPTYRREDGFVDMRRHVANTRIDGKGVCVEYEVKRRDWAHHDFVLKLKTPVESEAGKSMTLCGSNISNVAAQT